MFYQGSSCLLQKIRVKNDSVKKLSKIDLLMEEKKILLKKRGISVEEKVRVLEIDEEITQECEDKEYDKLVKTLGELESETGQTNNTNIWRQLRKSYPKKSKPIPTGIKNIKGKVITNPDEKKKITLNHFRHRMRKRPRKQEVKDILYDQEQLFEVRLKHAKENKSDDFHGGELEKVLKNLKGGKSKDPDGFICELFQSDIIGSDLRKSLLVMFNKMKSQISVPECLRMANITILHKKKCRLDLNNWRGIFVCSILRTILMKLIHHRIYEKVNESMTDSQIGARKNKGVRNHLFILNSIISDVMSSKKKSPIDLNIMDFKQMFDSEELEICMNSLYDANIKDDMFALIFEANKTINFAVKTPNGITKSETIENKVLQGDVLSPMISSNMVDKNIGKQAIDSENIYLYKNKVAIPPLTMQDDTLGISKCGFQARKMNNFLNTRSNIMSLQFGRDKCEKMHIGKTRNTDICVDFEVDAWVDEVISQENEDDKLQDIYIGKILISDVSHDP